MMTTKTHAPTRRSPARPAFDARAYSSSKSSLLRRLSRLAALTAVMALFAFPPAQLEAQERENTLTITGPRVVSLRDTRIRLGVRLNSNQGDEYDREGARLADVTEGSPAEDAGLRPGDIVTHFDGLALVEALPDGGSRSRARLRRIPSGPTADRVGERARSGR